MSSLNVCARCLQITILGNEQPSNPIAMPCASCLARHAAPDSSWPPLAQLGRRLEPGSAGGDVLSGNGSSESRRNCSFQLPRGPFVTGCIHAGSRRQRQRLDSSSPDEGWRARAGRGSILRVDGACGAIPPAAQGAQGAGHGVCARPSNKRRGGQEAQNAKGTRTAAQGCYERVSLACLSPARARTCVGAPGNA